MRFRLAWIAILVALVAVPVLPSAAQADIPLNDNYTAPRVANQPGTALPASPNFAEWTIPGNDPLGNINEATTQANMGDTSATNEPTSCTSTNGFNTPYGKTVWYRAFPHISGWISATTTGGDAVIRVVPLASSATTAAPNFAGSLCFDDPADTSSEAAFVGVVGGGGRAYAFQVGVFNNGAWPLQHRTRITFFPDRDLDGRFDSNDRCPTQASSTTGGCPDSDGDGVPNIDDVCDTQRGPASLGGCPDSDGDGVRNISDRCPSVRGSISGCPDSDGDGNAEGINDSCPGERATRDANNNGCQDYARLSSNTPYTFDNVYRGSRLVGILLSRIRVTGLPRRTRVRVRCRPRRGCRRRKPAGTSVTRSFLRGRFVRLRTTISLRLTKRGYIGRLIRFRVKSRRRGGFRVGRVTKSVRCIPPGGRRARRCRNVSTIR